MLTVLFNGPPGVGKTTYCESFARKFGWTAVDGITYGFHSASFITSIRRLLVVMYAEREGIPYYEVDSNWDELYAKAKAATIMGVLGREWLFAMGDKIRSVDPDAFSKDLLAYIARIRTNVIHLVDDLGFERELETIRAGRPAGSVVTVYLGNRPGLMSDYAHGQVFDNDIRFCLKGHADLIDPSPDELVQYLTKRIEEQTRQR